jgi:2-hydroxy-3-oxopropionate reductase
MKIGFIGLGIMGRPMAGHVIRGGHSLHIYSRGTPPQELVEAGAVVCGSPREVAERCDAVITMVPDTPDVEAVVFGPDGIAEGLGRGKILIDMSSISPMATKKFASMLAEQGCEWIDAPVSGGDVGARNATLSIMIGGDADSIETFRPIFEAMGNKEKIIRIGDAGAGQICKACNQLVIGGTLAAVGEAFALARKSGVDPAKVRAALMGGFAASRVLEVHGQRMLESNFKPGFPARLYRKDMKIVMEALNDTHTPAPVTALVQQLLSALLAEGREKDDYSSLGTVIGRMARLE